MGKICGELARQLRWGNRPAYPEYVRLRLGRTDPEVGETFLTELSPIPATKVTENQLWRDSFRKIEPATDRIIETRLVKLSGLIDGMKPRFIFCYGCEHPISQKTFMNLFPGRSWRSITSKSQMSESEDGCYAVLMPFFGNGRLSTAECETVIHEIVEFHRH
jgi:hypothetical protein